MQHDLLRHIAEVHVIEPHIALHLGIGDRAVAVGVLPRPEIGAPGNFHQLTVLFLGVDQCHITLVCLRRFVQQLEDSLGAGECHNNGACLLGDLAHRHGEAAAQLEERGDCAKGQAAETGECHPAAQHGDENVLDIA